jgi:dienelactone hydrolase
MSLQRLADSFGRAGYLTVAPVLFNGTPAPAGRDPYNPSFNQTEFLARHNPTVIDPMIDATIRYIRNVPGINRIVASGYCFGGRHAVRVLAEGRGVSASFAAHPALLQDDEILGVTGPVTIAAAENDFAMSIDQRRHIEDLLLNSTQPYSLSLYSGTEHGFGVRGNVSIPKIKFAKEEAYFQAVRWFDTWGKGSKWK